MGVGGASLPNISAKMLLDVSSFINGIEKAKTATGQLEDRFRKSTALMSSGDNIKSVGEKLSLGLTVPIVGAVTASTNLAMEFEKTMSKVKSLSGANGADMDKISKKALELGKSTAFSAQEAGEAFTYMAQAGWTTKEMLDGVGGVMNLASADGLDLAKTSEIVTSSLSGFGYTAKDTQHFVDVLAKASSSTNSDVTSLGEAFKFVAPICGSLGYSAEDASFAIGLMSNAGIKGSQAGTSLRMSLSRMIDPTKDGYTVMKTLGIQMADTNGKILPMSNVLGQLREKFKTLTKEQQVSYASTLFGTEAMSGMLAIINTSDEKYNSLSKSINNADGASQKMAKTLLDNASGAMENFKGSLETIGITFGMLILPTLTKVIDKLNGFASTLLNTSDSQKKFILILVGVLAVLPPLIIGLGSLISAVGAIGGAIGTVTAFIAGAGGLVPAIVAIGSAVLPVIAIIGAVVAVGYLFVNAFGGVSGTMEFLKGQTDKLVNSIVKFAKEIKLDKTLGQLKKSFEGLTLKASGLKEVFEITIFVIRKLIEIIIKNAISGFKNFVPVIASVMQWLSGIIQVISGLGKIIKGVFTGDMALAKKGFNDILKGIVNIVKGFVGTITNFFAMLVKNIISWFKNLFDVLVGHSIVPDLVKAIIAWFGKLPSKLKELVDKAVKAVINSFKSLGSIAKSAYTWGKDLIDEMVKGLSDNMNKVVNKAKEIGKNIKDFIGFSIPKKGYLTDFRTYMPDMIDELTGTLDKSAPKFYKGLANVSKTASNVLNGQMGASLAYAGSNLQMAGDFTTSRQNSDIIKNSTQSNSIMIGQIVVRDDNDINKISKALYNKDVTELRTV